MVFRQIARALLSAIALAAATTAAVAQDFWQPSPFPGEEDLAVMGCSDSTNEEAWSCLAVRCENDWSLGLYTELTNLTLEGEFTLVVGEVRFPVSGRMQEQSVPYSNRLDGDVSAIVAAMKAAEAVVIDRPRDPLNPGFDTIPLRGAAEAISALEARCTRP
jgi:hypothetical protein